MAFSLPPEIQDQILHELDLPTLYYLAQTSRRFAAACLPHLGNHSLKREHCQHALYYAIIYGNSVLAKQLLVRGRGCMSVFENGTRVFSYKTFWRDNEAEYAVKVLMKDGVDAGIHSYDSEGCSSFRDTADFYNSVEFAHRENLLPIKMEDPTSRFEYGPRTALEYAVSYGRISILTMLLGGDVGMRPSVVDIKLLETLAAKCLLKTDLKNRVISRITERGAGGNTMLHKFVAERNEDMVRILVKFGAGIEVRNDRGETPVSRLCDLDWVVGIKLYCLTGNCRECREILCRK